MHLQSTAYGNFLQNEPSPISTTKLAEKLTEKLVEEFNSLRIQAVEPLATFLDYITCAHPPRTLCPPLLIHTHALTRTRAPAGTGT